MPRRNRKTVSRRERNRRAQFMREKMANATTNKQVKSIRSASRKRS